MFWYQEGNYVRITQHQPRREVFLTGCAKSIWELIGNEKVTVEQIIERLRDFHSSESVLENVKQLLHMGLITMRNYLWQEESEDGM